MGDKERQADTPSNTGTHMWEDNGRPWETKPWELGYNARDKLGDNLGNKLADKLGGPGKADTPSNKRRQGRQAETIWGTS